MGHLRDAERGVASLRRMRDIHDAGTSEFDTLESCGPESAIAMPPTRDTVDGIQGLISDSDRGALEPVAVIQMGMPLFRSSANAGTSSCDVGTGLPLFTAQFSASQASPLASFADNATEGVSSGRVIHCDISRFIFE